MERAEFKKIISDIVGNLSDQGKVTDLLTQLDSGFETVTTNHEALSTKIADYDTKIKSLQETNMNLFLRVSNPVETPKLNSTEPLSYDDLINDLGGVK